MIRNEHSMLPGLANHAGYFSTSVFLELDMPPSLEVGGVAIPRRGSCLLPIFQSAMHYAMFLRIRWRTPKEPTAFAASTYLHDKWFDMETAQNAHSIDLCFLAFYSTSSIWTPAKAGGICSSAA
jgi:hypothetical protein